jgi:hypothetical protein
MVNPAYGSSVGGGEALGSTWTDAIGAKRVEVLWMRGVGNEVGAETWVQAPNASNAMVLNANCLKSPPKLMRNYSETYSTICTRNEPSHLI